MRCKDCVSKKCNGQEVLEVNSSFSLRTYFQPIYFFKGGNIYGYEALTRITGGKGKRKIKELFKESTFDIKCIENTIKQALLFGIRDKNTHLFVNICPGTLMDLSHDIETISTLVDRCGISKKKIVFEITEGFAIWDYKKFEEIINYYKEGGYKIAIDDFGVGYGGLKALSVIKPDFVKIDRHFITDIDKKGINFSIVESIVSICFKLGIEVIAEGIEREEEMNTITNIGINLLQGYYLHRPFIII